MTYDQYQIQFFITLLLIFRNFYILYFNLLGEDGPSQMGLEDIAMFRALPGSTVFYPSDAVATERACELAANTQGICFIRTSRPNTPVIYANDEAFAIGKAKVSFSRHTLNSFSW